MAAASEPGTIVENGSPAYPNHRRASPEDRSALALYENHFAGGSIFIKTPVMVLSETQHSFSGSSISMKHRSTVVVAKSLSMMSSLLDVTTKTTRQAMKHAKLSDECRWREDLRDQDRQSCLRDLIQAKKPLKSIEIGLEVANQTLERDEEEEERKQ